MLKRSKRVKMAILMSLVFAVYVAVGPVPKVYGDNYNVEQWRAVEITLTSTASYSNPFTDVDLSATFTGPGNTMMTVPGFWDGGSTWRIRFAPTAVGTWTYSTNCSDTGNAGLHNKTGSIACTAYSGNLDIYKHGFVSKSANGRYLTYHDGTPFFYLGDTHWMGLSYRERLNSSNDARWTSEFKGMADTRASQGYTVYKMNFFAGEWGDISPDGTYNEGGHPWNNGAAYKVSASSSADSDGPDGYHLIDKKAFDGNTETYWRASGGTYPQWLKIDLGASRTLNRVETVFGNSDTWKYKIEGSTDGTNFSVLADRTGGAAGQTFTDNTGAAVRYVRITVTGANGGSTASIREFKVYDSGGNLLSNQGLFKDLNPGFWQNCDQRIQYVASKGMVADLGVEWGRWLDAGNLSDYQRVMKYIVARYGAYSTIWDIGGEFATGPVSPWHDLAAYTRSIDAYARLNTLNNHSANPSYFRGESWYDLDNLQGGHGSLKDKSYWLGHYNETPVVPVLEGECNYENINGLPSYYTREPAWKSIICGGCGVGYGAEGLWQATWDPNDTWQVWGGSPTPWYSAIDKPAGAQMQYLKDFFTSLDWWSLSPDSSAVTWSGAPSGTQEPYQKANSDRSLLVAYLPSCSSTYTGTVNGLSASDTYTAKWFNTRTGAYTVISRNFSPNSLGNWSIPAQPDTSDWALLIQKTTNRVEQPVLSPAGGVYTSAVNVSISCSTAGATIYYTTDGSAPTTGSAVYSSAISVSSSCTVKALAMKNGMTNSIITTEYYTIDPSGILLSQGKTATASTENGSNYAATKAIDGDTGTYWCATSGAFPQWLKVDLGATYNLTKAVQTFYTPNLTWKYRIETSNDDITYTTLVDRTSTGATGTTLTETLSGSARYVRITLTESSSGDWATSCEFKVYGLPSGNLALNKTYSSSSDYNAQQVASKAFDGNLNTNWQAANGRFAGEWLSVDFGTNTTFNKCTLSEYSNRTTGYRIEYWNGSSWQTAYTGTAIACYNPPLTVTFNAVTGSKARIYFTSGWEFQPIIYEFGIYHE